MQDIINQFKADSKTQLPDVSHYAHDGNEPLGSNPGGVYTDPHTHQKHYIKMYANPDQARSEVAAAKIYEKLGAKTTKPQLAMHNNQLAVITKWQGDLTPVAREDYSSLSEPQKHDLSNHFHAAVLTKNWDTVGLHFDNLCKDATGRLCTVDTGGSFNFRAQGGHKDYGHDIGEHKSLRDPTLNPQASHAFSKLGLPHMRSGRDNVGKLTDSDIHNAVKAAGLPQEHGEALIGRRDALLNQA